MKMTLDVDTVYNIEYSLTIAALDRGGEGPDFRCQILKTALSHVSVAKNKVLSPVYSKK